MTDREPSSKPNSSSSSKEARNKEPRNKEPRNMSASVRRRLLNHAREQQDDYQYTLTRYGLERLLYRLSQSKHAKTFVLKGATLFRLWTDLPHRPTRDLDLLGHGEPSIDRFRQLFQDVCDTKVEDDGLEFLPDQIRVEQIKDEDEYQGLRLRITARLGNANLPLQIDVGFGDAITPKTENITFPTMLDQPAPNLQAYPRETVVAEKYQAMVMLGMANSRMKDFFDLWILATEFEFAGTTICNAIRATFDRRQTNIPASLPVALTPEFTQDAAKAKQWTAFVNKGNLTSRDVSLSEITTAIEPFLMEPTRAILAEQPFTQRWLPSKGWH